MKRTLRLIALLLAVVLTLQAAVLAADPPGEPADGQTAEQTTEAPEEPSAGETPDEPPAGETPDEPPAGETPDEPPAGETPEVPPAEEVPEPIVITASLADGDVVHTPAQTLTVEAAQGETPLRPDQLLVTFGGAELQPAGGEYALTLSPGKNVITVDAETDGVRETLELAVYYEILVPDGWAHDALAFCVANGILNGDQNGDLLPENNATRAQLAAMLVRLFDARPTASLSGYSDVPESAWYHDEMARAVAMGIFEGSGGRLNPEKPITREQAFTVLSRAFGVASETLDALKPFPDGNLVSVWAKNAVAGMLEAEYIHGSSSGKLNPGGYITRQELAQVLYNALDCITDRPDALTGSRCLYTGPIDALEGVSVDGDLIVSSNDPGSVSLDSLRVSGRLTLHLHSAGSAVLGPVSGNVSLCSPVRLELRERVDTISCLRDGADVTGVSDRVVISGGILRGSFNHVTCLGEESVIAADTAVGELYFGPDMAGKTIAVFGTVSALYADVRRLHIAENGYVQNLYKYYDDLDYQVGTGQIVDRVDVGLQGVQIVQASIPDVFYDVKTVTVTGAVTGVNTARAYGVPDGIRTVTVTYRYGGKVIKTDPNFRLTNDAVLSCEVTPDIRYQGVDEHAVTVTITYGGQSVEGTLTVRSHGFFTPYQQALNVQTCKVQGYITYSTGIYGYSSLTSYLGSVSAGSMVQFIKSNGSTALIETSGGLRGWIPDSAVRVSWQKYHNDDVEYSKEVKEAFVNQVHDYSSSTNYLIWCNLYTTTVNIFQGSKGNWKLIMSGECVIGTPATPTRPGIYSLYSRAYYWSFDDGIRYDNSRCYYASLFDGGIAFHTRLYYTATNTMVNSSLSAEISHGCVRCPDEIAKFIYYQCPLGTRVVVY